MDPFLSEKISAGIGTYLANHAPVTHFDRAEAEQRRRTLTPSELSAVKKSGARDYITYDMLSRFLKETGLCREADETYLFSLFSAARTLSPEEFLHDPYLKKIRVPQKRIGNFLLTTASYEAGEWLQYEMPDFDAPVVVPHLGFFPQKVTFPTVYEGNIPWMSVCPSEISSMRLPAKKAHGRVLVLGLGLGYYPFLISKKQEVTSVTVVELKREVVDLFTSCILPQFPEKEKIRVIQADAFSYLSGLCGGEYDFVFADIWENQADGAEAYRKIRAHQDRMKNTEFSYWIEKEILSYINVKGAL